MTPFPRFLPSLALLCGTLVLGASCESLGSGGAARRQDVGWLVDHGEYLQALRIAEERARSRPDDVEAREAYRIASVAVLLERARRDLFAERDTEALAGFRHARELAPDDPTVAQWIAMTKDKLARVWTHKASAMHIADDLEGAIDGYERALEYVPGYAQAQHGLARALLQVNYRRGMGEKYYSDGIEAFHDLWLEQARTSFEYSLKYNPDDPRARERHVDAQHQLALQRIVLGRQFEDDGKYAAARNEYRMALLLDADNATAQAGMDRMIVECRALDLLEEAELDYLAGQYDDAVAALDRARAESDTIAPRCDDLRAAIGEARLGEIYDRARVLESDQRFDEALAVYGELLDQAPYFRDAIARRDTLEDYVAEAERLYAQAAQAEDSAAEAALLRRIAIFWPEYRDVETRLARLEAADNG